MKLIDYDKHREKIQAKIMEGIFSPGITCGEAISKIMNLLDSLPAEYTEDQITEIDQAYKRVCRELEDARREAKKQETIVYAALLGIITDRIDQIETLLLRYPDGSPNMIARLDELNMILEENKKWHKVYQAYLEECGKMHLQEGQNE